MPEESDCFDQNIVNEEVNKVLKKMKAGKAAGLEVLHFAA